MTKKTAILFIISGLITITIASALFVYNIIQENNARQNAQILLEQILYIENKTFAGMTESAAYENIPELPGRREFIVTLHEANIFPSYPIIENAEPNYAGRPQAVSTIGILNIPAIGITLPIISELTYANVNISAARFSGRVTDRPERLVIGGHNFRAHFAGISNMNLGDIATFQTHNGDIFYYEVIYIGSVHMSETETVLSGDYWDITLFTCMRIRTRRSIVRLREL